MRSSALLAVVALAAIAPAALRSQEQPKPRLDAVRVAGEAFGGAYAGIGGFVLGRFVGTEIADLVGVESEVARRRAGHAAGIVTGAFATSGAVFLIVSSDQSGCDSGGNCDGSTPTVSIRATCAPNR